MIKPFSSMQHRGLANIKNHDIYTTDDGEIIWMRKVGKEWERNMPNKEFEHVQQASHWLRTALGYHYKRSFVRKVKPADTQIQLDL